MPNNFNQKKKMLWSFFSSIAFSIIGLILIFNGLLHGKENAFNNSRPKGATSWSTSDEAIKAFTYLPILSGVLLLILAIIIFTITFYFWIKNTSVNP
ncbi:hypothetical protein [Paenibacillus anseongense]|uniref:hypothetical protein n=1 Tax=Paenibacillus anseongense TaxID=2682845 RepID=UPI002DBB4519|nr:hypothetical protein [Paenibacillus anseongense]MEC0270184.1 hypothetical protein [Paenibacillus anseongense]